MKKVTIYFKSGNKITFTCKNITVSPTTLPIDYDITMDSNESFESITVNRNEIEAIKIHRPFTQTFWIWIKAFVG